eukprot:NODE_885_length_1720_cov_9.670856_g721_i0.p1 GENE.NODE_885_length_1720_cov_9.670856_g721_i0~~NODE_885_length_1720_cov_9.670856_g721_i0.p1  ORF type:complete len:485 (-),score=31.64 NODE_885_length_1720_cov_9.670856_g721_i0:128-1582(-)
MGDRFSRVLPLVDDSSSGNASSSTEDPHPSSLFLGTIEYVTRPSVLPELGINAILAALPADPTDIHDILQATGIPEEDYFLYPLEDSRECQTDFFTHHPTLSEALQWVHHRRLSGKSVLVHCDSGICRSAAVIIAYLMQFGYDLQQPRILSLEESKSYVSALRTKLGLHIDVTPFIPSLRQFETILRSATVIKVPPPPACLSSLGPREFDAVRAVVFQTLGDGDAGPSLTQQLCDRFGLSDTQALQTVAYCKGIFGSLPSSPAPSCRSGTDSEIADPFASELRESWQMLEGLGVEPGVSPSGCMDLGRKFYAKFREIGGDRIDSFFYHVKMEKQQKMFMSQLRCMLWGDIQVHVRKICMIHRGMNLDRSDFQLCEQALLWALKDSFGSKWNDKLLKCWSKFFKNLFSSLSHSLETSERESPSVPSLQSPPTFDAAPSSSAPGLLPVGPVSDGAPHPQCSFPPEGPQSVILHQPVIRKKRSKQNA